MMPFMFRLFPGLIALFALTACIDFPEQPAEDEEAGQPDAQVFNGLDRGILMDRGLTDANGLRPDARVRRDAAPQVDAGRPDAGQPRPDASVCRPCQACNGESPPTRDERCRPVNCEAEIEPFFHLQEADGQQVCLRSVLAPKAENCDVERQRCAGPAQVCQRRGETVVTTAEPPCELIAGCQQNIPPEIERNVGAACNGDGQCLPEGYCSVSGFCQPAGEYQTEYCGEQRVEAGGDAMICTWFVDLRNASCDEFCTDSGGVCFDVEPARNDCQPVNGEHDCEGRYSDAICHCQINP